MYQNIEKKYYNECLVLNLNNYLNLAEKQTKKEEYEEFKLYNLSYKVGEIIQNILIDIINDIKITAKNVIYQNYLVNLDKIKTLINYKSLLNSMKHEIDSTFNSTLLKSLKNKSINNINNDIYPLYDFNEGIINPLSTP